ncbi:MAG: hypothetical protein JOY82_26735 [Streptosporangiaceae bacterium]|nr:hypothetical protein [Streptosporangiaceae bacterium]MBV9858081.1 hypothetical protein [Streptosporangiaceae bacterium]
MSEASGSITVTVEIIGDDPERLDELTGALREELGLLDAVAARRAPGRPPPPGTRGGIGLSLRDIILSGVFSAGTLGAVVKIATEWIRRSGARRVVLEEDGDRLELGGQSRAEQREIIERWIARHAAPPSGEKDA